ncbi:hypothetical protein EC971742_0271, partial [Escherichia coli 97.1742]
MFASYRIFLTVGAFVPSGLVQDVNPFYAVIAVTLLLAGGL